jgi:hypothetical protein
VYDELERDPATHGEMEQLERLKAATPSPPDSLPRCARRPSQRSRATTPIDGVWRMDTKYGDIPSDPSITPENYGEYIFVFDRGRFAFTQHFKDACTWGYGTYVVAGRRVAWSFLNGGGIAPNNAFNKPGEHFVFGWSLYRGELVLTGSPAFNFRAKPWRRVSPAPTRAFFDKRCLPPSAAEVG